MPFKKYQQSLDPELFWDEDVKAEDKTYNKIGGFVEDYEFAPKRCHPTQSGFTN